MANYKKFFKKQSNPFILSVCLAAYFTLIFNLPFIINTFNLLHQKSDILSILPMMLAIALAVFCIFTSLFSVLTIKYLEKPLLILIILLSAILSYSNVYYGVIFDDRSPILTALEQSDWAELSPFLNFSFFIWLILLGVLPAYFIFRIKIRRLSFIPEVTLKVLGLFLYPLFYSLILVPNFIFFQPIVRVSGLAARPPLQIIPINFLENAYNHYNQKLSNYVYQSNGLDAKNTSKPIHGKKNLLVLVIGESARSQNFSLNGYQRNTNPFTPEKKVISFKHVTSCGTCTHVSVPCIFSLLPRKDFTNWAGQSQDNLLDVLVHAGLSTFWIDNNGPGDCQGVCKNISSLITHKYDEELVKILAEHIKQLPDADATIVLHLKGSHGPDYYSKYPKNFQYFLPECKMSELRLCQQQYLMNAYDNSIRYTDFVISELINLLNSQEKWSTALIYTSDHGESLGESWWGHCVPFIFAPKEQIQVPLLVWTSQDFAQEKHLSLSCLEKKANEYSYSHDNFFHSVLGLMDIKTSIYQPDLDLFQHCRT